MSLYHVQNGVEELVLRFLLSVRLRLSAGALDLYRRLCFEAVLFHSQGGSHRFAEYVLLIEAAQLYLLLLLLLHRQSLLCVLVPPEQAADHLLRVSVESPRSHQDARPEGALLQLLLFLHELLLPNPIKVLLLSTQVVLGSQVDRHIGLSLAALGLEDFYRLFIYKIVVSPAAVSLL